MRESPTVIRGFSRVLVSVDFSMASKKAIDLAQLLLNKKGIIYAIHVIPDVVFTSKMYVKDPTCRELQGKMAKGAMEKLSDWVEKCLTTPVKIDYAIGAGDPADEIIKAARGKGAQLIVMGVHGQRRADLGILGSTVDKVIRSSDCPVICVPPEQV